jgi:glycosyltransferase involved in cell wall biosynthesis
VSNLVIDTKFLTHKAGIGNDTRQVLSTFKTVLPQFEITSSLPNKCLTGRRRRFRDLATSLSSNPIVLRGQDDSDYIFIPHISGSVPKEKSTAIWRIHDLFPITNPEWFTKFGVSLFMNTFRRIDFKNNFFLCNSQATANSLLRLAPVGEENFAIVPCSIENFHAKRCENCEGCELHFTNIRYLLSVNTIEPRKNITHLANIWEGLNREDKNFMLIVVGKFGWKVTAHEKEFLRSKGRGILHLESACDGSLEGIFDNAVAFISTSFAEGFNIPAEKARKRDLPLFLSDIPTHRELYDEDKTIFFDLSSIEWVAKEIQKVFASSKKEIFSSQIKLNSSEKHLSSALKKWNLL